MPWGTTIIRAAIGALLFAAAVLAPAMAAPAAAGNAAQPAATTPTTAAPALSTADLQDLVTTLKNDAARAKLIATLEALIAARQAAAPAVAAPAPPGTFIERLTAQFQNIASDFLDIVGIARAAPGLVYWIRTEAGSPESRMLWLAALLRLFIIFGAAALAWFAARRALRGLRRRFEGWSGGYLGRWLVLFLGTLLVELLPLGVFGGVATLTVALLHPRLPARPIAMVAIVAVLEAQALMGFLRVGLIARPPYFIRLGAESRAYLFIWARRFIVWAIYGFATAEIAWWFGAPGAITALLIRLVTLVLAGLAIVFVLQNRVGVAQFLRGHAREGETAGRGSPLRLMRSTLADGWHILAIVYILGSFGTYFVDLQGGIGFVLRATVASIVILIGTGLALRLVRQMSHRGFALSPEMRVRYPGLETRANRYLPALILILSLIVYCAAVVLLLEAWGIKVLQWFEGAYAAHVAGTLASILLVVLIAILIWEVIGAAIERALGNGRPDREVQLSARLRTLLPLVRTTVLIAIVTIAGFVVLSQLGVDIAPLLAGAGIVGIAVGLGSQALVKDVINGLFVLLENTLAIGEVVDVGSGHSGVVEAITIRAIRLRDAAGSVHTVPFSAVNAVINLTREFAYYVADVSVAYEEDTDRVVGVLKEIDAGMRADPAFAPLMLAPIEIWGIDSFGDSAVVVKVRLKTKPIQQWTVGREFNRRMKQAFDRAGISFPYPHRTIDIVGKKAEGGAL